MPTATAAPSRDSRAADAGERASPTTSWPDRINSATTAEPTKPDPPVTKIFIGLSSPMNSVHPFKKSCFHQITS